MLIYIDSSVVLAAILDEQVQPPAWLWERPLVSSRLLVHEVWNRVHAYGKADVVGTDVRVALGRIAIVGLDDAPLARSLSPFPIAVRTLDGLHLSTLAHVRGTRGPVELATYDHRMADAAQALGFPLADLT